MMKTAFAIPPYARNTCSNVSLLLITALAVKGNGTG